MRYPILQHIMRYLAIPHKKQSRKSFAILPLQVSQGPLNGGCQTGGFPIWTRPSRFVSETGRMRFRRVRFQTLSSVSGGVRVRFRVRFQVVKVPILVTRIAATSNRKSLATALATQKKSLRLRKHLQNCDFIAISAGKACDFNVVIGNR